MKAVNLLPSDQRGTAKAAAPAPAAAAAPGGSPVGAYAVLGALALLVLMVGAYTLVGNSIKDRQTELARVQAEAQVVQAQVAAMKPYYDFQQMATQRVATVKQLAESRFDWERALRDVSRALPGDVHLKSFRGTVSNGVGGSGSGLRSGVPAPAIELSGCTSSQSDVAKLMARLRGVRGVTRVSLAKSDKGEASTAGAAASSGPGQGPLCGGSAPPAFELVMFFERSAVAPPVATAPGQAAPAGQPAPAATPAPGTQPSTDQPATTEAGAAGQTQGVNTP